MMARSGAKNKMDVDADMEMSVEVLLKDLANIKDDAFCINFCLQAVLSTYATTHALLSYARRLVQDIEKREGTTVKPAVLSAVYQAVRRLGTWQLIRFGSDDENGEVDGDEDERAFDGKEWQRFRVANMVGEMRRLVGMGKMAMAVVVWRRHRLDENLLPHVQSILDEMPESVPTPEFIPWLRNEVLPHIQSQDRVKLSIWIEQRARITEMRERSPHNALQVISLLNLNVMQERLNVDESVTGQIC
ncbi:hypothetical protein BC938DRAFT_479767, partial [Jimgerdemannia flammicorona]